MPLDMDKENEFTIGGLNHHKNSNGWMEGKPLKLSIAVSYNGEYQGTIILEI